jgi:soluble lytic murein transglycosylase-like protein
MKTLCLFVAISCVFPVIADARPVQARPQVRPVVSVTAGRSLTPDCVAEAAQEHGVPLAALMGILAAEGGTVGEAVGNTNGSWDLGAFQINTCNLNALVSQGFMPEAILRDGCENARAAAWILRREFEHTGDIWSAIGAYHSRTPELRDAYIARVRAHLVRMMQGGRMP